MAELKSVSPVSNEDVGKLPVKDLPPALAYYESVLGFSTVSQDTNTARLKRDDAEIGLVVQRDHQPNEAGSLAFRVDDLDALHRELAERGGKPGALDIENWGGKQFRTFFMREDENGYCYCFYCPV
jgi:predicted enzyme related to lactoylglutathione lyase